MKSLKKIAAPFILIIGIIMLVSIEKVSKIFEVGSGTTALVSVSIISAALVLFLGKNTNENVKEEQTEAERRFYL